MKELIYYIRGRLDAYTNTGLTGDPIHDAVIFELEEILSIYDELTGISEED